jgi:hypothetical protein
MPGPAAKPQQSLVGNFIECAAAVWTVEPGWRTHVLEVPPIFDTEDAFRYPVLDLHETRYAILLLRRGIIVCELHKEIRHFGESAHAVDVYVPDRTPRHGSCGRLGRVLNDCEAPAILDSEQARRAVIELSCEYDTYNGGPICDCGGAEQGIDCGPREVLVGSM